MRVSMADKWLSGSFKTGEPYRSLAPWMLYVQEPTSQGCDLPGVRSPCVPGGTSSDALWKRVATYLAGRTISFPTCTVGADPEHYACRVVMATGTAATIPVGRKRWFINPPQYQPLRQGCAGTTSIQTRRTFV